MNKEQIWKVLECCLLAGDESSMNYLIKKGFEPEFAKVGIRLYQYLKSKQLNVEEVKV